MLFWLFCLAMSLLIPVTMIALGRRFLTHPPRKINGSYGYRTTRSMKNQQTWDFAHQTCGRLWVRMGLILRPVSAAAMLPALGRAIETVSLFCIVICVVQVVVMLFSIFPVERALKRQFDGQGRPKT